MNQSIQLPPKQSVCCFTGHRDMTLEEMQKTLPHLQEAIERNLANGVNTFLVGGAIGFDTLAAIHLINLRRHLYPQIELILVIPCEGQDARFTATQKMLYETVRREADREIVLAPKYYRGCMFRRNDFMVANSQHLIAYVRRDTGGSAYTFNLAQRQGLQIQNLAEVPPPLIFTSQQGLFDGL